MSSGLFALLDDVVAITKLAAASLDDVGAAAGRAGVKAAGVVVDDAAVTPRYVAGLSPQRELPIIARITLGSLRNKLLILLPAALLLSALAPWSITPLLMLGGAFLCYEGAEKVIEAVTRRPHHEFDEAAVTADPALLERQTIAGAVRTDLILSAEIMAIALAEVADQPLLMRAIILAIVAIGITLGVYGVVALIVKLDDIGLYLARRNARGVRAIGRALVKSMPPIMGALTIIGTAAMIWVGGGILVHGLETFHLGVPAETIRHLAEIVAHAVAIVPHVTGWLVSAAGAGLFGLIVGGILAGGAHLLPQRNGTRAASD